MQLSTYSAIVGKQFETRSDALEHYFAEGWRLGVAPHPLFAAGEARVNLEAARALRDAVAAESTIAVSEIAEASGNALALVADDPDATSLKGAFDVATWGELRRQTKTWIDAVRTIRGERLFDASFYAAQRGVVFLSEQAALDDYLFGGEHRGLSPNPFFQPAWRRHHDPLQRGGNRRWNQLIDFVQSGRAGAPSPRSASDSDAAAWRERAQIIATGTLAVPALAPARTRHTAVADVASRGVLVIVDINTLRVGQAWQLDDLHGLATQAAARIVVIDDAHLATEPRAEDVLKPIAGVRLVHRTVAETFGAAAARVVATAAEHVWTLWRPTQRWKPGGMQRALAKLDAHPEAPAVAVRTRNTPQDWVDSAAPLWVDRLDGAAVLFRRNMIAPTLELENGVAAEAVLRAAALGGSLVMTDDVVWARASTDVMFADRGGFMAARAMHIAVEPLTRARAAVIIPTWNDWVMTERAVRAVLATTSDTVRIVVVDNGSTSDVTMLLHALFADEARVELVRLPRNTGFAFASDFGARVSNAETLVFLNNDTIVQPGWLDPLVQALESGAVAAQPLLLRADGTVQSAGTVSAGGFSMPVHLLADIPEFDIPTTRISEYAFRALTAACLAIRADDYAAVGGFDMQYVNGMEDVDLTLRLAEGGARALRVVPASRVTHLESRTPKRFAYASDNRALFARLRHNDLLSNWSDRNVLQGTALSADIAWTGAPDTVLRESRWSIRRVATTQPRALRWSVHVASPATLNGDRWGDTFFAHDLAHALRARGQNVTVHRASGDCAPLADSADVVLNLRGRERFVPQPGAVNLLWVISHPDLVSDAEIANGWDRVYAAGAEWAREATERTGIRVQTLLQATDPVRFQSGASGTGPALFVGRTRGARRQVVHDAVSAEVPLAVYGDDGWEALIPAQLIAGAYISNDDLGAAYRGASVVLNDHWHDMVRGGFLSNRLFDAAATGARIVSDDVPGLHDIFGDQVQTYESVAQLRAMLSVPQNFWPTEAELRARAAVIARDHSFDARAEQLVHDAIAAGAGAR